ncbi:MAG: hypothetical protein E3J72_14530 [Planctomycetota bacterium]|nr:MAG: hypothetical protein E3J72_14530 [Planctomycetota bacterium]
MKSSGINDHARVMWDVVESFYRCMADFQEQYETYERLVGELVKKYGEEREKLHLDASEVATLVDQERLGTLRDEALFKLKELSHLLFRTDEGNDDFDRYVSEAYHEMSVLREEHYSIEHYIPAYEKSKEKDIAETMLSEAADLFPLKMRTINQLFEKAKTRLEKLLPKWKRDTVFVRSLYLFGNDFLEKIYADGIESLYGIMYPKLGPAGGYFEAAKSFHESGFYDRARIALRKAKAKLKNGKLKKAAMEPLGKKIEKLAKSIESAQSGRLHQA